MTVNLPLEELAKRYSRYYIYIEPVISDPLIRGYFNLVASLLLIAFFLVFALSPTVNTILTLQKKITEQRQTVAALDQKIADLVTAQANYSQVETSVPALLTALPETPTPQTIISGVTATASSSGLVISSMQFRDLPLSGDSINEAVGQSGKSSGALPVKFSLGTTGAPDKIRDFLVKIEKLPRQIHIVSLGLTKTEAPNNVNSASVTALGYYLPNQANE